MLKQEFKEKDVNRIRNLVRKKGGDRTILGVGYTKPQEFHKEGDIWDEGDYKWTIQNGIKQNITKLDKARSLYKLPLFCPTCGKLMYEHRDSKFYQIHRKCLNCVIDTEQILKNENLWETYQKNIINSDIDGLISMYKNFMLENINIEDNFITEKGQKQNWVGGIDKEKAMKTLEEGISFLQNLKKI